MIDILTFGETMALLTPTRFGLLRHASSLELGIAGAESNVAIGATRLGATVRWIGRIGDDELGQLITMTLRGQGVDVRAIQDGSAPTGLIFKEPRNSSTTRVAYYRAGSAGSRLAPTDIDSASIEAAQVLHVTGITTALSDSARATVLQAVTHARQVGTQVSFDINHRSALWKAGEAIPVYQSIIRGSDIVFATEEEARLVVDGHDAGALAQAIAQMGPSTAIIKLGAAGAVAFVHGRRLEVPAVAVTAIDPVGAGDAFAAGYLAAYCTSHSPEDSLDLAARVGAFAVTVRGDWEGVPTHTDLALLDPSLDGVSR